MEGRYIYILHIFFINLLQKIHYNKKDGLLYFKKLTRAYFALFLRINMINHKKMCFGVKGKKT